LIFAAAAAGLAGLLGGETLAPGSRGAGVLAAVALLSLVLVNAQAVTAITSERDTGALDLLLVTDLTPKEIVFGKLGGALYNSKEMVLLPMLLCVGLYFFGVIGGENLVYLLIVLATMFAFAATLGLHAGMTYSNSAAAVATSLGTVFFLLLGVAACMRIMLAFSGSFSAQFLPFFAFMVFGSAGLYAALGARNPSSAICLASFLCPPATFYAITSYLMTPPAPLAATLAALGAYGFATAAMLVPAICEFDVATGRTTAEE
jgi:ABC-type transport system involved in multi-copper enzyme maturation permease subunit